MLRTYEVKLKITIDDDVLFSPAKWDWKMLIDMDSLEEIEVIDSKVIL